MKKLSQALLGELPQCGRLAHSVGRPRGPRPSDPDGSTRVGAASVRRVSLVCASPDLCPHPEAIGVTLRVPEVESGLGVVLLLSPNGGRRLSR